MTIRPNAAASLLAIAAIAPAAAAQTAYTWNNALGGFWDDALNWSPSSAFPNLDGDTATIGLSGAFVVDLDRNVSVTSLDMTNPDAILEIRGGNQLQVYDRVTNDAQILVNSNVSVFDTFLDFATGTTTPGTGFTLDGSGRVTLGAPGSFPDARVSVADGLILTHAATHTIDGAGQISGSVLNAGLINANVPGSIGIRITDNITQSGAGTISANDANIVLNSATIDGGSITTSGAGALTLDASPSVLTGAPVITGTINVPGGGLTLQIASDSAVNGVINVNSSAQVFNATLQFSADAIMAGSADILMQIASTDTNDARIDVVDGFVATLGPNIDVSGAGRLTGSLDVRGSIDATSTDEMLEIFGTVTLLGSGVIRATGGQLGLNSATINNPNFESSAGGRVRSSNGVSLLSGSGTNSGTLAVLGNGHTIEINDTLTNNGVIQINPDLTVFNATLLLTGSALINGTGQIQLSVNSTDTNDARLESAAEGPALLGAGQTVFGEGRLVGDFLSNARIEATSPTHPLELRGNVTQGAPGVVAADAAVLAIIDGSITGGTLETSNDGVVTAANGLNAVTDLTNTGDLGIDGTGTTLTCNGVIVNNGRILINRTAQVFNANLDLADAASITGTGEINLTLAGADFADARIRVPVGSATIGAGQTITGSGRLQDNLTIEGTIAPGASVGEINCNTGTITRTPTSAFEVELLAADGLSHDRITGSADHVLAGALVVTELPGYVPAVGDQFTLITGTSITGEFDSVTFPATLPNRVYRLFYESDHVLLVHTCDGDFAPPYDVLDFSDVLAFLAAFGSGSSLADLAPPFGVFDFSDVIAFLTAFGSGCP